VETWPGYLENLSAILDGLLVTGPQGESLATADAYARWVDLTREVHDRAGTLFFAGNGGSAMIASHMAADASKNGGLRALAFNDAALLTAVGNDVSFDEVFASPLKRLARSGDLLTTISSSGNSPNVVRTLEAARQIGMHIVTLSGMGADNRSRRLGDLNFYVAADRYGWAECAHQVIIHYWCDQYLNRYGQGAL
jgi:D-sedoheptulose 7-phosphate isomerase